MPIKVGNNVVKSINIGNNKVQKVTVGNEIVFTSASMPTYTGQHIVEGDANKGMIKCLSSGTLKIDLGPVDMFLVGGGGAGSGRVKPEIQPIRGGGGGCTKTIKNLLITTASIVIGSGGKASKPKGSTGSKTTVNINGTIYEATGGIGGNMEHGAKSGSGGGACAPLYTGHSGVNGGSDGSDGKSVIASEHKKVLGGIGQHTTTRAFEDSNELLYAGGGGGVGDTGFGTNVADSGKGGSGGGGDAADYNNNTDAIAGTNNSGGGGGAGYYTITNFNNADGGSGIVIVRWGY